MPAVTESVHVNQLVVLLVPGRSSRAGRSGSRGWSSTDTRLCRTSSFCEVVSLLTMEIMLVWITSTDRNTVSDSLPSTVKPSYRLSGTDRKFEAGKSLKSMFASSLNWWWIDEQFSIDRKSSFLNGGHFYDSSFE